MRISFLLSIFLIFPINGYCETMETNSICYKEKNCKAGDVIILEFQTMTKPGVTRKVAQHCDFDKTIYTYQMPKQELKVACVYIGKKRTVRQ